MGIDDAGKLHIKKSKTTAPVSESRLHIRPRSEGKDKLPESPIALGRTLINTDMNAEFKIVRLEGEPGERHVSLERTTGGAFVGKNEAALLEAIEKGKWRVKV